MEYQIPKSADFIEKWRVFDPHSTKYPNENKGNIFIIWIENN